eukprot:1161908-Pelagomonas_calceolata.AAC.3
MPLSSSFEGTWFVRHFASMRHVNETTKRSRKVIKGEGYIAAPACKIRAGGGIEYFYHKAGVSARNFPRNWKDRCWRSR